MIKKIIIALFLLSLSLCCFASYNPNPSRILVSARYTHAASNASLSAMSIGYVDFGTAYLTGSGPASYTAFNAPQAGTYMFDFGGWRCGGGDGVDEVIDTRGGSTIVYDQAKAFSNQDCTAFDGNFIVPNVLAGDVITFKLNENNTITPTTSITDNAIQGQGSFKAYILQTYP